MHDIIQIDNLFECIETNENINVISTELSYNLAVYIIMRV